MQVVLCLTTLGFVLLISPLTHTQGLHWDLCLSPVDSELCMHDDVFASDYVLMSARRVCWQHRKDA